VAEKLLRKELEKSDAQQTYLRQQLDQLQIPVH